MAWVIEVKGGSTPYVSLGRITTRNVIGEPAVAHTVETGTGEEVPGVLRYRVTRIQGTQAFVTCRILSPADAYHPLIHEYETAVEIGAGVIQASAQVGDEYEIGYGYYWDETTSRWLPVRAFGVLIPNEAGPVMSVRFTNTWTRPQIYTEIIWSNNGPGFWSARMENRDWSSAAQSPLYVNDEEGVNGMVKAGHSFVVEFRPDPLTGIDNTHNPVILTIRVVSYTI